MDDLTALIEFRDARLAEDEAAAKDWQPDERYPEDASEMDVRWYKVPTYTPARVLHEVGFKRWLLAEHAPVPFWGNNPPPLAQRTPENVVAHYCACQCPDGVILETYPCDTVRRTLAIWSEHPDYREGWKP